MKLLSLLSLTLIALAFAASLAGIASADDKGVIAPPSQEVQCCPGK